MNHPFLAMIGFLEICVVFVLPIFVSYRLCKNRGRSTNKGVVVTILFVWIATLLIWLFLADKRPRA